MTPGSERGTALEALERLAGRGIEPEADYLAVVVRWARLRGWLVYHTHNSRHSAAGFPDLVLVRPPRLIFAELKRNAPTERARERQLSRDQRAWLEALDALEAPGLEVYLWRPADWPQVKDLLT